MNKETLRIWAKNTRKLINTDKISLELTSKLVNTEEYKSAKNIMIYYPLKNEVNLLAVLKDESKNFYLPRIKGDSLECCEYKQGDELCESCFHTQEPTCKACSAKILDMVVVPALAVDKNNYRLGYGGGFYDKFLQNYKGKKVVCIPKKLITQTVYPEKHDIKMNLVITS